MGTRNIILVKHKEEYKVAQYSQFDGYPRGNGYNVVKFLTRFDFDINHFKRKIDNLTYWTEEELNLLDESIKNNDITDVETKYPELSRELGPDIFDFIYNGNITKVFKHMGFVGSSLFCEWGWSINLDSGCLDCFRGFQKEPLTKEQPFYFIQEKMDKNDKYYPIKLICSIPFDELSKFDNNGDFNDYIYRVVEMGDKPIMDNGIPVLWEDNI
jgi:hypothetical protein